MLLLLESPRDWVLRFDRNPVEGEWTLQELVGYSLRGYQSSRRFGCRVDIPGDAGCRLEGGFLLGETKRHAREIKNLSDGSCAEVSLERDWERGYKVSARASIDGKMLDAAIGFERTTIDELTIVSQQLTRDELNARLALEVLMLHLPQKEGGGVKNG